MQALLYGLWALAFSAAAAVAAEPLAKGIQDNSFLIEEAYNQEAGVVQHITNLRRQNGQWQFSFSQEWPVFSQTHQFSYSVPYNFGSNRGVGDITLNYRYQAQTETVTPCSAMAHPMSGPFSICPLSTSSKAFATMRRKGPRRAASSLAGQKDQG
jgi:hypothetical protein